MNKLLNDALRAKGYKGPDIKMVLTDVTDPNGPYYTDTLTNVVVFDRKMLASLDRDKILNILGHEFGHYSKEDNKTGNQTIANYSGNKLEARTKGMVSKEATEDTLASIRNNKNVITGEEGKQLAESIPMDRREYYEAFMFKGSITKLAIGGGGSFGFVYNKDPITGKEEYGYVGEIQGLLGINYDVKKVTDVILLNKDWGIETYQKKGKPIKDFQGITAGLEGKIAAFGVGIEGSMDTMEDGKISGNGRLSNAGFKVMLSLGYRYVHKIDNPSEGVKYLIRTFTNNPEKLAGNIEAVRMLIDVIKKAEELKKNKMKKIKNKNQAYILYILVIICLLILNFIILIFFIDDFRRSDITIFTLVFGVFSYFITKAIINGVLYFVPREECYIEDKNFVYKRILFSKFILKKIKIPLLDIENIIDRGYKIPSTNGDYLNPLNYITIFFKPYERILIEMKSGEKYKIFVDANPYPNTKFLSYHDDNEFIKNYNDLKELIENEQKNSLIKKDTIRN